FEKTLGKTKSQYFPNLANHFRLAGIRKKAIAYSIAAGDQLLSSLSFWEARTYFQHAYQLLKHSSDARKWVVGLKLADTLMLVGELNESLSIAASLRIRSRKYGLEKIYYRACITQFGALRKLGNYRYLSYCRKLLQNRKGISSTFVNQIVHLV